jgi:uncharacterized RDD family membrane protein YckC
MASCTFGLRAQEETKQNQPQPEEVLEPTGEAIVSKAESVQEIPEANESSESVETVEKVIEQEAKTVSRGDVTSFNEDSFLGPNERSKDMVTIGGNANSSGYVDGNMVTILGNSDTSGYVDGNVVTIAGKSELNGYVDGNFVVIMGSAGLGPKAEIDGNMVVIGGRISRHPDSKIDGRTINIPFLSPRLEEQFQALPLFVHECIFLGRPISPNVRMTLYVAGIFLIFYLLLGALFPRQIEKSRKAIEDKPLQSFFAGVLVMALYIPFVIILVLTFIGILFIPLLDIALLSIAVFGKAVSFIFIGRQIARAIRVSFLENPILSILIGGLIAYSLYMIPFFGLFLWIILSILGLGAVCVAIGDSISSRKAENQRNTPPPLQGSHSQQTQSGSDTQYSQASVQPGTALSQIDSATAVTFSRIGFWWRTLATIIDVILISLITSILEIAIPLVPFFVYFIVFWGWKGSTLGGMALGLRVQKISGEPMDWSTSLIRSFSSIVSFLPFCLGFFWAGWDPDNQSWHDKIAGTTVVRVPKGYTWN